MSYKPIHVFAPAKINLFLHITGKREDGYHTLQSLMGFVDVGDDLTFEPHDGLYIDVDGTFASPISNPRDNLVYKAAILLSEHYKIPPRAKIILTKNLPIASGLGGGSSDAAATLQGLAKLWILQEEPDVMAQIAQKLGADVTACLYKKLVWSEGIGEKITRLPDMPNIHFVLANPMVQTPTPEVFKHFRSRFNPPILFSGRRKTSAEWIADLKIYRNDLTDAAIAVTPEIRDVLSALGETKECLLHRLSGTGATCYGIYSTPEAANIAAHTLEEKYSEWWVVKTNMLQ